MKNILFVLFILLSVVLLSVAGCAPDSDSDNAVNPAESTLNSDDNTGSDSNPENQGENILTAIDENTLSAVLIHKNHHNVFVRIKGKTEPGATLTITDPSGNAVTTEANENGGFRVRTRKLSVQAGDPLIITAEKAPHIENSIIKTVE